MKMVGLFVVYYVHDNSVISSFNEPALVSNYNIAVNRAVATLLQLNFIS
mgnify:CR=1 FL=1